MALPEINWTTLTDTDVSALKMQATLEEERRYRISVVQVKVDDLSTEYLKDVGRTKGASWVQPTGAHDAYPLNYIVVSGGKTWKSKISANVWAPGLDPRWWEDMTPVDEGVWNPNYHSYLVDDVIMYNGVPYKCLQTHTSQPDWTPLVVPALWFDLTPALKQGCTTGETIYIGASTGTRPGTVIPQWDPNAKTYAVNDQVLYLGVTYKCIQAHTSQAGWTPLAVASLWTKL
jgi:hypothetical protein